MGLAEDFGQCIFIIFHNQLSTDYLLEEICVTIYRTQHNEDVGLNALILTLKRTK